MDSRPDGIRDGTHLEELTLRWENEAWTALGMVSREQILCRSPLPMWEIRQFLLFAILMNPIFGLAPTAKGAGVK